MTLNALKTIAMAAMLGDHLAWAFLPQESAVAFLLHTLGAMAMPIFTFALAEGYRHTRHLGRYMGRLALFALVSYLPFAAFSAAFLGEPLEGAAFLRFNMIYSLLIALIGLWVWDTLPSAGLRLAALALLCLAAIPGDGMFFPLLWALAYDRTREDPATRKLLCTLLALAFFLLDLLLLPPHPSPRLFLTHAGFRVGKLLPVFFLLPRYNGARGKGSRWLFYVFYPAHLALLAGILMFF